MTSRRKLIAGTVAIAVLAGGGAALAAIELSSSSSPVAAPAVTASRVSGIDDYGLGPGRLGGRGLGGGLGPGEGSDGYLAGGGFPRHRLFRSGMTAAATYLGVSEASLRADVASGQTLAQVAHSQAKTVGGLVAAMVGAQRKALAAAVVSGFMTQAQADQLEHRLAARMTALVDGLPRGPSGRSGDGARSGPFSSTTA